jgi:branched-chain amino acid transport system permease protein
MATRSSRIAGQLLRPSEPHTRHARDAALVLLAGLAIWAFGGLGAYDLRILTQTIIFATAAVGLNVLVGFGGIVSVGHAAFMAIGGYAWARLAPSLGPAAIPVGVAIAVATAAVIGVICLRFRGYYLAVATLAFGLAALVAMRNWDAVTSADEGIRNVLQIDLPGLSGIDEVFMLSLIALTVFFYLQNVFRSSPVGNALVAARWNEEAASSVGISIPTVRVVAFVLSAVPACIAGALLTQLFHFSNPDMFDVGASINLIAIPIIAGRGWRWAPLLGAAVVIALPEYIRFLSDYRLIVYGALLTAIALFLPNGLRELAERAVARWPRRRPKADVAAPAGSPGRA